MNPVTTYAYTLRAVDYHGNYADTTFNVTTPYVQTNGPFPSATPEGRRVGVRSTGAYWGASGENIDVRSGNLNFTLPLLKAQARSGWGVGFNLTYNSQNWRYDSGGNWNFGSDVGYGFGWQLLAGSLTPVLSDPFTVSYYLFADSTGAEYRLDQNSGNIWTSKESIYVSYDAEAMRLYFRDGSFWYFGCISAVGEADQGVMYPTLMQDTNGNQVLITYQTSPGASWSNSSARITQIEDARGNGSSTYSFTYDTATPTHLTAITSNIGTGENYTFSYLTGQSVCSPFNGQSCVTTATLRDVTINVTLHNTYHEFTYNGSAELTQILLPYKGYLSYDYTTTTYSSSRSYREVLHRYLSKDGISSTQYPFSHESSPGPDVHQYTVLDDPGGVGEKYWAFATSGLAEGLATQFQGRQLPGPVAKVQNDYTWTQDAVGNSYIASVTTTADPGQSYAAAKKSDQTVDTYGNVTQVKTYEYGNLTTPVRTDNFTYLTGSCYTSNYIFNRLTSTPTTTVAYDEHSAGSAPGDSHEWVAPPGDPCRGNPTTVTSPGGAQSLYYDFAGGVLTNTVNGLTASISTTNSTNYTVPSQITVGSLSTSTTYNSFLGLTNQTAPNGASTTIGYDVPARPNSITSPFGATTATTYNDTASPPTVQTNVNGRWTRTTMDGLGRTTKTETGDGSGTISVAETVYDSCGCSPTGKMIQTALTHAPGATPVSTAYTYDGIGRTLTKTTAGTDTTSTTSYSYQGNMVTVTDAVGNWKKYTTNALGQLIQVNEPNPGTGGGGGGPITLVQHTYARAASPIGVSFGSNVTSGNLIVVAVSADVDTSTVSSISDTLGNTYARIQQGLRGPDNAVSAELWYAKNVAGGATSVTVTMTGTNAHFVSINEISGLDQTNPLDQSAINTNPTAPVWSSGSQTTSSANELVFGFEIGLGGSQGSGFSLIDEAAWNLWWGTEYRVVSSTGSYDAQWPSSQNGYGEIMMATFRAAGSGGGGGGGDYITTYAYDTLGHLISVSMPRSTGTQTRTFNYGNPPGGQLLSATNPENGTVSYTYNSDQTLATKTDAKNQQVQYSYDSYKRVTEVRRGTYNGTFTEDTCQREDSYYDTNPFDGSFSQNTQGRLAAVQYKGGYNASATPTCDTTFTEMYGYTQAGSSVKKRLQVARAAGTFNLDSQYTYDNEGRMTAEQYPSSWSGSSWVAGPNLGNTFDSMGRLQKLTDLAASSDIISSTSYGAAGQLLTMTGANGAPSETRTYNSIGQLTQLQSGSLNIQYAYSATQNNGKITSETDVVSGEQVTYTYDSLNRLASATSSVNPGWGQSYAYDGFGNLTTQTVTKGTAPSLSVSYDPATNRRTGECADANGNLSSYPVCANAAYYYDVENRIWSTGTAIYSYAPGNKRVWRGVWSGGTQTVDEVTYWGVTGQKLVTYQLSVSGSSLVAAATGTNEYFGGKLIKNSTGYVTPDRLGSIGKYFPYGQERPSATTNGTEKFATYFRDSDTGLDYAQNRYYQPGMARFMTTDPYIASAKAGEPGSWNRYAYTRGDPVNRTDPLGQDDTDDPNQCAILDANPELAAQNGGGAALCYQFEENESDGGGGVIGFYDPNDSVFSNDLGQVGPGSGNDPLALSGKYDLNNGAPGFGPLQPGVPPKPPQPDCQSQILNAVNNQFGTNLDQSNILPSTSLARQPGGQVNLNLSVSGGLTPPQFNEIQPGRYAPPGLLGVLTGYGPSLHVVGGPSGLDQNVLPFTNSNIGGVYSDTFTAHIDSAWAYNPIGAVLHGIIDVLGSSTRPSCP